MQMLKIWNEEDALEEWKTFVYEKFFKLCEHIIENQDSLLTKELLNASIHWPHYPWPLKRALFDRIKLEYARILCLDTYPLFFTLEEWKQFCSESEDRYHANFDIDPNVSDYYNFLYDQKRTCFISINTERVDQLDFFPALKDFGFSLATDFIYQKIKPVHDSYCATQNNLILVHKDPNHRLQKALGTLLKYKSKNESDEKQADDYINICHKFQMLFSGTFLLAIRHALWRIEGNNDPVIMLNMIQDKVRKTAKFCESIALKYSLERARFSWDKIDKIGPFKSCIDFLEVHDEYNIIRREIENECMYVVENLATYEDKTELEYKDQQNLMEVLPSFTSIFDVTGYAYDHIEIPEN